MADWSRLVRYVNSEGLVRYGEPILEDGQENSVHELANSGRLEVRICEGNRALDASAGSKSEKVSKLLGPLTPEEVPIIRCIGLNYRSHSK